MSDVIPTDPRVAWEFHIHPASQKVTIVFEDGHSENFYGLENLKKIRSAATEASHGAPDCELELTDGNRHTIRMLIRTGAKVSLS